MVRSSVAKAGALCTGRIATLGRLRFDSQEARVLEQLHGKTVRASMPSITYRFRSQAIACLLGVFERPDALFLVMEFCAGGAPKLRKFTLRQENVAVCAKDCCSVQKPFNPILPSSVCSGQMDGVPQGAEANKAHD
ncbi:hypothetical protein AK812_SmicGene39731 [Symbiodinium microadriaticum]|uniref:Protein kinase domain-containing protein n=1 Tax=Symbiodinium microadriaticum TaxID=2951 RepID=A0A1Q9CAG2_SYMMI|nr:hypothetical protein AK812_SmicGene39731 [Symbiodinium microadriaticum]